jgi:hypothetical protein
VSRRRCPHLGRKLSDARTCGRLCAEFPGCLPEPSPELLERVSELRPTGERSLAHLERIRQRQQISEVPDELHIAILRGLSRKPEVAAEELPDA